MIYVFDTSSLRSLQHFYPRVFKSIWAGIDNLVKEEKLISTREVYNELDRQAVSEDVATWAKNNKHIFKTPDNIELLFVSKIFEVKHFHSLIGTQQRLQGTPVADPFVVACAYAHKGTVVTEEGWDFTAQKLTPKPNAAKIPNVCDHFKIKCVNLEEFMHQQSWNF